MLKRLYRKFKSVNSVAMNSNEDAADSNNKIHPEAEENSGDRGDAEYAMTLNRVLQMLPPVETRDLIFGRLDRESKKAARLVCKTWKSFVEETVQFCPILNDDSSKAVLNFGSTGPQIEKLTVTNLQNFVYPKEGLGFSSIVEIELKPYKMCEDHFEFNDGIVDLIVIGASNNNLIALLDEYANIQRFTVHSDSLRDITGLKTVQLNCLKEVKLTTYNLDTEGFVASGDILKNTFLSLKYIDIEVINRSDAQRHLPLYYKECYTFLVNHANTLEDITLHHFNCTDERKLELLDLIQDHDIPQAEYLDLFNKIGSIKVSSLDLRFTFFEGRSRFQFGIQLLKSQTYLTSLTLINLANANIGVWRVLPEVLRKSSDTLQEILIEGCFCPVQPNFPHFSCTSVKNCGHLKSLNLRLCGPEISHIEDLPMQIEVLSLGQSLSRNQIDFISKNMNSLVDFDLSQGKAGSPNSIVPKVTVEIFKKIIKLPCLQELTLKKRTCALKRIRRILSYTNGIEEDEPGPGIAANFGPSSAKIYMKLRMDRNLLDCSRL